MKNQAMTVFTGGGAPENSSLKAFTLAEVLITLGIIGVVAAMTLPTLINNKQNRELKTALKKNYSILQQVFQMISVDYGETIVPTTLEMAELKTYFLKYFRYSKDCGFSSCTPAEANGDVGYIVKSYRNYNNTSYANRWYLDDGQLVLNDGAMLFVEHPKGSEHLWISVDVNGINKKPNRWGHDLFTFQLMSDGKLLPMGAPKTTMQGKSSCSLTDSGIENGIGCTFSALTDENYWKNLPK